MQAGRPDGRDRVLVVTNDRELRDAARTSRASAHGPARSG